MTILFGWAGIILTVLSQYIIVAKKWWGFVISIIGNICWIVSTHEVCVVVINAIFILINLRGIYTWKIQESKDIYIGGVK